MSDTTDLSETREQTGDKPSASPIQKIVPWILWAGVAVVALSIAGKVLMPKTPELPVYYRTPDFSLIDQTGKPFTSEDLRKKVYICDFIFTTCGSVCPMLTKKLVDIQSQTPAEVQLVSFTVDAEHDTPPVLANYATAYGADQSRWHFLTGKPETMAAVISAMKMVALPATKTSPIVHDEHILLIDAEGNVRGIYDSNEPEKLKQLVEDATWLWKIRNKHGI